MKEQTPIPKIKPIPKRKPRRNNVKSTRVKPYQKTLFSSSRR